jgi:type IX secretion system PorP/SprF family membrane protein
MALIITWLNLTHKPTKAGFSLPDRLNGSYAYHQYKYAKNKDCRMKKNDIFDTLRTYRMKKTLHYFLLATIMGLSSFAAHAQQDPQYSLYMFDKMALNPAAAGSKDAMEANLIARDQWLGIPGAPKTGAFTIQAPISGERLGWGEVMSDMIGPVTSTSIQGNIAGRVHLLNGQLSAGIGLGLYDYVIDFSKINYKDQSDPFNTGARSQTLAPTAELGLYYYSHSFYMGLSVNHLIAARLSSQSYDSAVFSPHAYFIIGQGFQLSRNLIFNPSIVLKYAQNAPPTGDITLNFLLQQKLWLGVSYRSQYGLVFLAAYRISTMFQLGYAYDLGLNSLGTVAGGSHEISLTVDFGNHKTVQASPRYF